MMGENLARLSTASCRKIVVKCVSKTIDLVPNNTDTKLIFEHAKQHKALKNKEKPAVSIATGFSAFWSG